MDPELVKKIRQWKAGMERSNQAALHEALHRTPAERFANLQLFLNDHGRVGLAHRRPESGLHFMPYREMQERWLARHS